MSKLAIKRITNRKTARAARTRFKLKSNLELPRLSVFRSNKFIYAQVLDQLTGKTLAGTKAKDGKALGAAIAQKAIKLKIKRVIFDKGPYSYHGQVKLVADSARESGLEF